MRRQGLVWLSGAAMVLAAAGCFSDPTSSLRSGPSRVVVTEIRTNDNNYRTALSSAGSVTYADVAVAESLVVAVQVVDGQGNFLAFDAPTYGTGSGAVAKFIPLPDTTVVNVPGNTLWKGMMIGVGAGTTTASVGAAGLTYNMNVKVQ